MNEKELLELKQEIEDARQEASELKGEKQALLKRLNEDWDCISVKKANALIDKLAAEMEELSVQIKNGLAELDKYFE